MKATVRSPYVPENDQNQEAAPHADEELGAPGATAAGLRRVSLVPAWVRPGCAHGGARLTPGHHRGWGATPPREAPPPQVERTRRMRPEVSLVTAQTGNNWTPTLR